MRNCKNVEKKQKYKKAEDNNDWEARQNLFEFFSLLLNVDKRVNPHLYKVNSPYYDHKRRSRLNI